MSSSQERVTYVVEHLNMAADGNVSTRAMMGEHVVYYRDKVLGGIYNDRLLIKPTASARSLLPDAPLEIPYPGAKEMLLVDDVYRDKVLGGIYNDRLLIKPTASARSLLPDAPLEIPYPGAKEMLLVDDVEDRELLQELLTAMYPELPERKARKKRVDAKA